MTKTLKLTAVLTAGALMALGTAVCGYAAEGWQQSGDDWYYYGTNGQPVTDEIKSSGENKFYLGYDGRMAKDYMYEDDNENIYYFNSDGAMVTDCWIVHSDDSGETAYYYFDGSGKAAKRSSGSDSLYTKTIDGKTYGFDDEGRMLYGWVDEDGVRIEDEEDAFKEGRYYFGDFDDGEMKKNAWLEYTEGSDEDSNVEGISYEDMDVLWFFFDSSGKKTVPSGDRDTVEKNINGNKYLFDKNGVMLSSWIDTNISTDPTASPSYKFFSGNTDGHLEKEKWIYAVPDEDMDEEDYNDEEYSWFYVDKRGEASTNGIEKVKGKKYAFDDIGRMQTEFVVLSETGDYEDTLHADEDELTAEDFKYDSENFDRLTGGVLYYFDSDEEKGGQMKTGKSVKIELSDGSYTFGFDKNGRAYGGDGRPEEVSRKYYINGLLLTADKDMKYGVVETDEGIFVVNSSGTVQKGDEKALKDGNDGYILIKDDKYYGYTENGDRKPLWKDGEAYEYDGDGEDDLGDMISEDTTLSDIPSDMIVYAVR